MVPSWFVSFHAVSCLGAKARRDLRRGSNGNEGCEKAYKGAKQGLLFEIIVNMASALFNAFNEGATLLDLLAHVFNSAFEHQALGSALTF